MLNRLKSVPLYRGPNYVTLLHRKINKPDIPQGRTHNKPEFCRGGGKGRPWRDELYHTVLHCRRFHVEWLSHLGHVHYPLEAEAQEFSLSISFHYSTPCS
jgi:hypothetical protein